MDFGHLHHTKLAAVDFSLPPEPSMNAEVLSGKRAADPKVYVGCPRWGVKEWVGKLYPKGTKDSHFLEEYIRQFNCVELNSTFYNLYDETTIRKWADKAGGTDFVFLPKVFQGISHEGHSTDKLPLTHAFDKSISAFAQHGGPAFLQLSDAFGPQRKAELREYLQAWPASLPLFVEIRHTGWFQSDELEGLVRMLRATGKGLIITDTAGRRDVCHMHLSAPMTMVRFVANNLHPTDHPRVDQWVQRIGYWLEQGLSSLYFIIHMDQEKHSPELAAYLIDRLNERCGLTLKKPSLLQQELF
jgi:uncharacterized protein YecE (DUF72 family)